MLMTSQPASWYHFDSARVEKPADIVPALKDAVAVTETGAPFLLEFVVKEGHDFSRYA